MELIKEFSERRLTMNGHTYAKYFGLSKYAAEHTKLHFTTEVPHNVRNIVKNYYHLPQHFGGAVIPRIPGRFKEPLDFADYWALDQKKRQLPDHLPTPIDLSKPHDDIQKETAAEALFKAFEHDGREFPEFEAEDLVLIIHAIQTHAVTCVGDFLLRREKKELDDIIQATSSASPYEDASRLIEEIENDKEKADLQNKLMEDLKEHIRKTIGAG